VRTPRLHACLLVVLLGASSAHGEVPAPASPRLTQAIPPQELSQALRTFEDLTGLQGLYLTGTIANRKSGGSPAGLPPGPALTRLLRGTGLAFEFLNSRSFTLALIRSQPVQSQAELPTYSGPQEEVVVTATRGGQPAFRVPGDVFVWNQDNLQLAGIKSIADIGALTPAVQFDFVSTVGSGVYTNVTIRGITDRHGSTTGIFLDDVALPAARSNVFGRALPYYFDLDRIEVWRGPQGTLSGADAQGGAVRFVSTEPSLTELSGVSHAEYAVTERGGPSFETGAAAGGPVVPDTVGFRASAWYRSDGGYVDRVNPFTTAVVQDSSNQVESANFRGALTVAPSDSVRVSPSLTYVSSRAQDSPAFFTYLSDPGQGRLYNGALVPQPFDDIFYLACIRTTDRLASMTITGLTSYYHRAGNLTVDDTESVKWGGLPHGWGYWRGPAYPASYDDAVVTYTSLRQNVFTQQLTVNSPNPDSAVTWLSGLAYTRTRDVEAYHVVAAYIPVLHAPLDSYDATTTDRTQWAGFGQVEWLIRRHLSLSAGARIDREHYDAASVAPPAYHGTNTETLLVPKLSVSYDSETHDVLYATVARGYAPAGVDAALPTCFAKPTAYPTDSVWSYELGSKFRLDNGRAHIGAVVFDARWNNGASLDRNCLVTHIPGRAESRGLELAADDVLSVAHQIKAAVSVSYVDARYRDTIESGGVVIVNSGDAVGTPPVVISPWNVTTSIEQTFVVREGLHASLRAEDVFHSRNPGPFYTGIASSPYFAPGLPADPSTHLVNLRAALDRGPFQVSLFLANATDSQPTLFKRNKGADASTLYFATTFRPRTLGLAGTWQF